MAILNKKLYLQQEGAKENFELATTKEELGSKKTISLLLDNVESFIGIDEDTTISKLKIKDKGILYAAQKEGKPKVVPGKQEYKTPGSYTFTAPYTCEYTIEIAGAGGGMGGGAEGDDYFDGGYGGRGELKRATLTLTKGSTHKVTVGRGGSYGSEDFGDPSTGTSGQNGGTSSFDNQAARGGNGGYGGHYSSGNGSNGSNGASYGNGGLGGGYDTPQTEGGNGAPGWVIITWK